MGTPSKITDKWLRCRTCYNPDLKRGLPTHGYVTNKKYDTRMVKQKQQQKEMEKQKQKFFWDRRKTKSLDDLDGYLKREKVQTPERPSSAPPGSYRRLLERLHYGNEV